MRFEVPWQGAHPDDCVYDNPRDVERDIVAYLLNEIEADKLSVSDEYGREWYINVQVCLRPGMLPVAAAVTTKWQDIAEQEGWILSSSDDYGTRIERDDEANTFASDLYAIMHVLREAAADEEGPHMEALKEWHLMDPDAYLDTLRDIWEQFPGIVPAGLAAYGREDIEEEEEEAELSVKANQAIREVSEEVAKEINRRRCPNCGQTHLGFIEIGKCNYKSIARTLDVKGFPVYADKPTCSDYEADSYWCEYCGREVMIVDGQWVVAADCAPSFRGEVKP
jgi:hypothetical protein